MYIIKKKYTWLGVPIYKVCNIENGKIILSTDSWNEANEWLAILEKKEVK